MKNDLCVCCDGRGFHWIKGQIISHDRQTVLANTYKQGPRCVNCNGTGQQRSSMGWLFKTIGCVGLGLLGFALLIAVMVILP